MGYAFPSAPRCLFRGALALWMLGGAVSVGAGDNLAASADWQPLLDRIDNDEHGGDPTHYDLALLKEGEIAVANPSGVLLFDGRRWVRLAMPRNGTARSLVGDELGRLHVGGEGEAGTWARDERGVWMYTDHTPALRAAGGEGPVWDTLRHGRATVFHTNGALLRIPDDGAPQTLSRPPGLRRMFATDGKVFARLADAGLVRMEQGGLVAVPGGNAFGEQGLVAVLPSSSGQLLVGVDGLFRLSDTGLQAVPLEPDAQAQLATANAATLLADDTLLVGNDFGELLVLDANRRLVGRIALSRSSILKLLPDNDGGVFVAAEDGLWRLRLPSPWRQFPTESGLIGRPVDLATSAGPLRVATTLGVFRAEAGEDGARFVPDIQTRFGATRLVAFHDGVLVADGEGMLWRSDASPVEQRLYSDARTWFLLASRFHPDRAYAMTDTELRVLERDGDGWRLTASHDLGEVDPGSLAELDPARIVMDDTTAALHVWTLDGSGERVAGRTLALAGINDQTPPGSLHSLDEYVYFSRGGRVWRVDGESVDTVLLEPFSRLAGQAPLQIVQSGETTLAIDAEQVLLRKAQDAPWQSLALPPQQARGLGRAALGPAGDVYALVWDGVLQYRPAERATAQNDIGWQLVSAHHVDLAGRDTLLALTDGISLPGDQGGLLRIDVRPRTLNGDVTWRYRLAANDVAANPGGEWSTQPTDDGDIVLPLPAPGSYRLHLEGKSASGRPVLPYSIAVDIVPAWWQTTAGRVALAAAGLLFIALGGYGVLRWRLHRVETRNRRLEKLVRKRTRDLEMTAASLAQANADLQASHAALKDSSRRSDLIFKALNDALEGEELDGRYRIEARLGSGGFGTVYRARHLQLGTAVAIKIFKPSSGEDREASLARFRGEGISAFRVQHPNAVQVIDFAICLDAVPYLVMELLEGNTLEAEVARRGPLSPRRAVDILVPVCDALAQAHAVGVIHRDVKPGNIFLQRGELGEVIKLIDFGIAKLVEADGQLWESARTATGLFVGTPNYMAPERLSANPYDERSDIFAVGVVAFELLCGRRPFEVTERDAVSLIMAVLSEQPADLIALAPKTPAPLAQLIMRLLERDPGRRPSAKELAQSLREVRGNLPAEHYAPAPDTPLPDSTLAGSSPSGSGIETTTHPSPSVATIEFHSSGAAPR